MWQELIVGICVLLALLFVLRRYLFRRQPGCGGCQGCGDKDKSCAGRDT
mgnify:CR=1 FL=1